MKLSTPAGNIIIGTLYFFFLIIICYITKRSLQQSKDSQNKLPHPQHKYNSKNITKALNQQKYSSQISEPLTILKSLAYKYSIVGTILNDNKSYMLKQMYIISIICVACTVINAVILWPLAIIIPMIIILFVIDQIVMKLDFGRVRVHQANQDNIQIEPVPQQKISKVQLEESKVPMNFNTKKYLIKIVVLSFITMVLISQTMFSLYNSVSNLGVLNLGSVAAIFAIDQVLVRPLLSTLLMSVIFIHKNTTQKSIFEYLFIRSLCENQLLKRIHQIQEQSGTQQNLGMSVSPTKKKSMSPSKVPKAQPLYFQSETLMNLQVTNRNNERSCEKIEELEEQERDDIPEQNNKSPIKNIMLSRNSSVYLTSAEKNMFEDNQENDLQNDLENRQLNTGEQQSKKNTNQFYSAQRLPRDKNHTESVDEDHVILVETGLNAFNANGPHKLGNKCNTLDVQFSPTKRQKRSIGYTKKKRQLIITGNSPYLEYLPDMMKKNDKNRKNTVPSEPHLHNPSKIL